jgi:hypothetical protein
MKDEYRLIEYGDLLTIGRVTFDPNGEPATVTLDVLTAPTPLELQSIVADIQRVAFSRPAVSLLQSGCEVISE